RQGGETPIADTRGIYRDIPAKTRDRFEALGVCYRRHLVDRSRSRVHDLARKLVPLIDFQTWHGVFRCGDRSVVDAICSAQFTSHEWEGDGSLVLHNRLPAGRVRPVTGETVWFNQAHMGQIHARVWGFVAATFVKGVRRFRRLRNVDATFG